MSPIPVPHLTDEIPAALRLPHLSVSEGRSGRSSCERDWQCHGCAEPPSFPPVPVCCLLSQHCAPGPAVLLLHKQQSATCSQLFLKNNVICRKVFLERRGWDRTSVPFEVSVPIFTSAGVAGGSLTPPWSQFWQWQTHNHNSYV